MSTDLQAVNKAIQEAQAAETRGGWIEAQTAWAQAASLMRRVTASHAINQYYCRLTSVADELEAARASAATMARAVSVRQQVAIQLAVAMKAVKEICS
jgi:hypothetical protein